jgi:excisionase family DNA binding protein
MTAMPPSLPKLFTIPEVARHLRVCSKTVRRMIKDGKLIAIRVGKQPRISERDLRAYLSV